MTVSPNEKHLLTLDINNNVLLWDIQSRKEIDRIKATSIITSIIFKDDSSALLFSGDSLQWYNIYSRATRISKLDMTINTVKSVDKDLYLLNENHQLYVLNILPDFTLKKRFIADSIIDISADKTQIYALDKKGCITAFSGEKAQDKICVEKELDFVRIAKQDSGNMICLGTTDGTVYLLGKNDKKPYPIHKFTQKITGIRFSKDSKVLFASSEDFTTISYDIAALSLKIVTLNDFSMDLWPIDVDEVIVACYDGNLLHFDRRLHEKGQFKSALEKISYYKYLSKNTVLLSKDDGSISVLNLETQSKTVSKVAKSRISDIVNITIPGEVIVASYDGNLYLFNYLKNTKHLLKSFSQQIHNIEYNKDLKKCVVLLTDSVFILDSNFQTLAASRCREAWFINASAYHVTIGETGKFIDINLLSNKIKRLSLPTPYDNEWVLEAHYSLKDSSYLVGLGNGKIFTYKDDTFTSLADVKEPTSHLYFNESKNELLAVTQTNSVFQVSLDGTNPPRRVFHNPELEPTNTWNVDYDKNFSRYLVTSGKEVYVFDSAWQPLQKPITFSELICVAPDSRQSAQFTDGGQGIFALCYDGSYHWNPIDAGKIGPDVMPSIQFSRISKLLKTQPKSVTFQDNYYRLQLPNEKSLSLLLLENDDWLVYDDEYRFDGSEKARSLLYFACNTEIIELSQVRDSLLVRNLVQRLLNNDNLEGLPKLSKLTICGVTPMISPIKKTESAYSCTITPREGGVGDIEVYINGVIRQRDTLSRLILENGKYTFLVNEAFIKRFQIPGENLLLKIVAKTNDNGLSSPSVEMDLTPTEKMPNTRTPSLYAVMIGIDKYNDSGLNLNYAAKDANDLQLALEQAAKKYYNIDDTNRVFFYNHTISTDARTGTDKIKGSIPTKENILYTLKEIEKKSKPEDILLFFFAGHGELVEKDQLLLFTTEATRTKFDGILMHEFLEQFNKIPAGKRAMILDACHSGNVINNISLETIRQSLRLNELDKFASKSGFAIITASSADQKALELPEYEHGLMTYALLNSMRNNKNSLDEKNQLQLEKWLMAAEEEVKRLSKEQNAERMVLVNFTVGKIDDEVRSSIVLKETPSIFIENVMNKNTGNDNLNIKSLLTSAFQEIEKNSPEKLKVGDYPGAIKVNVLYQEKGENIQASIKLSSKNSEESLRLKGKRSNLKSFIEEVMVTAHNRLPK